MALDIDETGKSSLTADTELPTAAALNGTWAKTTVTSIIGAAIMANDGTNEILASSGNGTAATAIRTTLASDGTGVVGLNAGTNLIGKTQPNTVSTTTQSSVAVNASSTTILALNASRQGVVIVNDASAILYLRESSSAATASIGGYTYAIAAGATLTLPEPGQALYTGQLTGIWAAATGNGASITEL